MKFFTVKKILIRLYKSYVRKYLFKLLIALLLSFAVAGSTATIAWLLDPAVKKIFIEQDRTLALLIPIAIVIAFSIKGLSLYFARTIVIRVGQEICKTLQVEMSANILKSDTHIIDTKHSGKFISHFLYDVGMIFNVVSVGVLNIMKDSLTLVVLISLMFYQNWKLACFALIMMPLAIIVARSLGKRIGKVTTESADISGKLTSFLSEMIKGAKMIKIYQQEKFEFSRSSKILQSMMEK